MAAALPAVDLPHVSKATGIPYGTLTRWAHERRWTPVTIRGRRRFYAWDDVEEAIAARQERVA